MTNNALLLINGLVFMALCFQWSNQHWYNFAIKFGLFIVALMNFLVVFGVKIN
jgi:hypothetical protein